MGTLPRLGVQYRLADPALLRFGPQQQTLELRSRGAVRLGEAFFSTASELRWLDAEGVLRLDAQGHWDRPRFRLRTRLDRLNLKPLGAVIAPAQDLDASGTLEGDVQIGWADGSLNCRGGLSLKRLELAALNSNRLRVACKGDQLKLQPATLRFGAFEARASGSVALNKSFDLQADVRRTDLSSASQDRLKLRIQGPWGEPRWSADGEIQLPEATGLNTPLTLDAQWRTPWLQDQQPSVAVDRLRLSAPG